MSPCTRDLVRDFLAELDKVKLTDDTPPLHVVDRRLAFASMIRTEIGGDDLLELALRALADALTDLCLSHDVDTAAAYVKAKRTLLEMLATAL